MGPSHGQTYRRHDRVSSHSTPFTKRLRGATGSKRAKASGLDNDAPVFSFNCRLAKGISLVRPFGGERKLESKLQLASVVSSLKAGLQHAAPFWGQRPVCKGNWGQVLTFNFAFFVYDANSAVSQG